MHEVITDQVGDSITLYIQRISSRRLPPSWVFLFETVAEIKCIKSKSCTQMKMAIRGFLELLYVIFQIRYNSLESRSTVSARGAVGNK